MNNNPDMEFDFNKEGAKLILEQLDGFAVADKEGRYIYVNKNWCDIMGFSLEEIKGKYVRDIVPNTKIDSVLKTGRVISGHPVTLNGLHKKQGFSWYRPILKDGEIVGAFVQVIFRGIDNAKNFSDRVEQLSNQLKFYQNELRKIRGSKYNVDNIIGKSKLIKNLKKNIENASRTNSTVLIVGETGCGKELVAHAIHDLSERNVSNFVKVNCSAIPTELLESEFFGYEEGAFTGAKRGGREGKFEMANNGSLFLDEINQMPLMLQPKLLRVLQEREIEKIGGKESIPVDVRIITATNISLEKLVREDKFRSDLYYRLNVVKIVIPSLRDRKEDIPLLIDDIIDKLNYQLGMNVQSISDDAVKKLMQYDWPGNVRELQNVIEKAMNISWGDPLEWKHFNDYFESKKLGKLKGVLINENSNHLSLKEKKMSIEKQEVINALSKCRGNKTQAATILGISRVMLYKKIKKYEIYEL